MSRQLLKVRGVVQGVGFRPAVYRLALDRGLAGFVRNDADGVAIEIEGDDHAVAAFGDVLRLCAPDAARIDAIDVRSLPARGERTFRVEVSGSGEAQTEIAADRATCDDCLNELFDPANRRYRYPFITCTNCGPRFTIVRDVPYDRARTTMAAFTMCAACRAEYENPADRRFHSETNACAECGPRVRVILSREDGEGSPSDVRGRSFALFGAQDDTVAAALRDGKIVAIKGLGGFHLAVDATNEAAVARLRARKTRPAKPFAVMARDLEVASRIAFVEESLVGSARPIVRLRSKHALAPSVASRLNHIGVMLPYTPLHHLLLAAGPDVLVMTSGNRADEPIAIDDGDALDRLGGIADLFVLHDRPIHRRADDSVLGVRRSRGFTPEGIALPFDGPSILALGAELKNTICATRGNAAYLSQHIGDLSHPRAFAFFEELCERENPDVIAHDLHPDYRSTRWAMQRDVPRIGVQHHHAHIASCMIDNGRTERVLGIAFDGTGCGPAGELWGGEFLVCDLASFTRVNHLRPIALPGGEAAIREPWRLAMSVLHDAGLPVAAGPVKRMLEKGLHCPSATSAGRWFDAVAALCGVRDEVSYEGQAAMELEAVAAGEGVAYPYDVTGEIDLRPMVRAIAGDLRRGVASSVIAANFHETLVRSAADVCDRVGLKTIALSGGCFQNQLLSRRMKSTLEGRGFEVLVHHRVPPNDGGIALGQAAVAAMRLRGGR